MGTILDKIADQREQQRESLTDALAVARQNNDESRITEIEKELAQLDDKHLNGGLHGPPYYYKKQWSDL